MTRSASFLFAFALTLPCFAAEPASSLALIAPQPTPPLRKLEFESGGLALRAKLRPGVPAAGATFAVELEVVELLKEAHPVYGKRRPVDDAEVTALLVAPAPVPAKKGAKAPPAWADARRAVKLADAGAYSFAFTPATSGIYGLYVRAKSSAGVLDYAVALPVGIWPAPEGAALPPRPSPEPEATLGDLAHGRAVCATACKKNAPAALPQGDVPAFLRSDFAAALDDAKLLSAMVDDPSALSGAERADLVYFLRSLHTGLRDLFPKAALATASKFTINKFGRDRLNESAKLTLDDAQATAIVFAVYKGELEGERFEIIDFNDRVARDRLKKGDKLGYVVFLTIPGEPRATELGIALGLEPTYPIVRLIARDATGARDAALAKSLDAFAGLGKFNDAKSLAKGPKALATSLLPVYLTAAELATMYYADEREFTAFDDEFKK